MTVASILKKSESNQKSENLRLGFQKTWQSFTKSTSIHGLKYTTDPDTNIFIRSIWAVIVLVLFALAIQMVVQFYLDFISNPTRMNIETDHAPLTDINFPAVTICPAGLHSLIKAQRFFKSLRLPNNLTVENFLEELGQAEGFIVETDYNEDNLTEFQNTVSLNRYTIPEFLSNLQVDCDDILHRCRFKRDIINCKNIFQKSKTYMGNCCSFNINQTGLFFSQYRAVEHGIRGGLSVILKSISNDYPITTTYSRGFKVIVHSNAVFPGDNSLEKRVAPALELFIRIRPTQIICSDQVRQLTIQDRHCVFSNEIALKYFDRYSNENCEYECHIENVIKICNCVPPYFFAIPDIEFCNFTKIPCLVEIFHNASNTNSNVDCNCPSNCHDITFDIQTNYANILLNSMTVDPFYNGVLSNYSIIHVYLNSQVFRRLRRDLLSNLITLISNLGSVFSLFIGMSIISVVEIIYFATYTFRKNYMALQQSTRKKPINHRRLPKHDVLNVKYIEVN